MKKNYYLLALLFSSLLFLSACGTNKDMDKDSNEVKNDVEQEKIVDEYEGKIKSTMEELFKKGKPTTCTFEISQEGQSFNGTLYIDGKKMRYESKGTIGGQTFEANVIVKDDYSYSWTNMDNKGYKMKEMEDEEETGDVGPEERVQEMDFDCKKGVEKGVFDLPSNIEFNEFNYDNSGI